MGTKEGLESDTQKAQKSGTMIGEQSPDSSGGEVGTQDMGRGADALKLGKMR